MKLASRQTPLTVREAEKIIRTNAKRLSVCYTQERWNAIDGDLSDYIVQMRIPANGSKPKVRILEATIPGQAHLEDCVKMALSRITFPTHSGETIVMNVPIEGAE